MEIIGKPWKRLPWQVTKFKDKFGQFRIQIKKYCGKKDGGWNFKKYFVIYCTPNEWELFKREIKLSYKLKR